MKLTIQAYHDKEVNAVHQKGSIYLGFRNGYIFSYRVINEKEKFSEILFSLDLAYRIAEKRKIYFFSYQIRNQKSINYSKKKNNSTEQLDSGDELHLLSVNGKEAIVVICGQITYYRIYNINPWLVKLFYYIENFWEDLILSLFISYL